MRPCSPKQYKNPKSHKLFADLVHFILNKSQLITKEISCPLGDSAGAHSGSGPFIGRPSSSFVNLACCLFEKGCTVTAREKSQGLRAAGSPEGKGSPVLCSYVGETPREAC